MTGQPERRHRMAVQRREPDIGALEHDRHDAGIGGIDQPHPEPPLGRCREPWLAAAIERQPVAEPPLMGRRNEIAARFLVHPARRIDQPVIDGQQQLVEIRHDRLLDDQRAIEPAIDLNLGTEPRMIPEGAGIGRGEDIVEALAGRDRPLRQLGSVHRIRHAHAMPMDHRRLGQLVDEAHFQGRPLLHPQHGPGHWPS